MTREMPRALAARLDADVAALPLEDLSAGRCADTLRSLAARAAALAARDTGEGVAALAAACAACLGHLGSGRMQPGETWPTVVAGVHTLHLALATDLGAAAITAARYELETLLPVPDVGAGTLRRPPPRS